MTQSEYKIKTNACVPFSWEFVFCPVSRNKINSDCFKKTEKENIKTFWLHHFHWKIKLKFKFKTDQSEKITDSEHISYMLHKLFISIYIIFFLFLHQIQTPDKFQALLDISSKIWKEFVRNWRNTKSKADHLINYSGWTRTRKWNKIWKSRIKNHVQEHNKYSILWLKAFKTTRNNTIF